ncbi:MAG TPA: phosphate ABC transporter substrate-binding protein PstS [Acetobacteraceae bacterium]|nr:phosphate ABC transporter substrate-binding protein PstS [Acetobacteraceae bacterium]
MGSWRTARWSKFAVSGALALGLAGAHGAAAAESGRLLETGSSLLYPLFNIWVPVYTKSHAAVQISTQSTGSGTGISESVSGLAQIGASDAYLSNALEKQHPEMLNIPLAISSQMVNYNLPGLNAQHLKLSGPVLAGIYEGKITKWNDPAIAKLNPAVNLPADTIVPVHRTDGSGDTFIFSQYLSDTAPDWAKTIAYGTTISWPSVQGGLGAEGNQGMVNSVKQTPYSIAYIGISFKGATDQDQLGEAMLENRAGKFVLPTDQTVQAAANSMVAKTPKDERISLIFAPGADSYPIINYEYAIIKSKQADVQTAQDLKTFLDWALRGTGGNAASFMQQVSFVPLPASVRKLSNAQIAKING